MHTDYGKIVRKARVDAGITMAQMAISMGVSPAYLSAMECGKRNVSEAWLDRTKCFFRERHGLIVEGLECAADISNQTVDLSNLSGSHRFLVASLARLKSLSPDLELEFRKLLGTAEPHNEANAK
jgi:hypothetical protein